MNSNIYNNVTIKTNNSMVKPIKIPSSPSNNSTKNLQEAEVFTFQKCQICGRGSRTDSYGYFSIISSKSPTHINCRIKVKE